MYSKNANKGDGGYVKVGATFNTYEIAGNFVSFIPDKSLTRWYGNKGYGLCLDLTADKTSGTPAIAKFCLKGQEVQTNKINGVATRAGDVASNVAGAKMVMTGTAGVAVFAPFKSFIIYEA